MAKKKAPKMWLYSPPKAPKPTIQEAEKKQVEATCQALIEKMKPIWLQPPSEEWGYVHDVYGKWYRSYYYFCATYRCDNPAAVISENETKFVRLEYAEPNKFHMAYFRHTGQWFTVFEDLSLESCLEEVERNEIFWP